MVLFFLVSKAWTSSHTITNRWVISDISSGRSLEFRTFVIYIARFRSCQKHSPILRFAATLYTYIYIYIYFQLDAQCNWKIKITKKFLSTLTILFLSAINSIKANRQFTSINIILNTRTYTLTYIAIANALLLFSRLRFIVNDFRYHAYILLNRDDERE